MLHFSKETKYKKNNADLYLVFHNFKTVRISEIFRGRGREPLQMWPLK